MKAAFSVQMEAILGQEWPAFAQALSKPPPLSIRVNPYKWEGPATHDGLVPWCKNGYFLAQRPVFTLDPRWHAGAYYVQEASSMLLAEALAQTADLERPLIALDLSAAPGGKSTLMAAMLSSDSFLLANEVIRSRYHILRQNLVRWGLPNVAISNHDPADFAPLSGFFDLILVDAPCSGEGLFRKDPGAMEEWSPEQVTFCAARQRRILADAVHLLAPGGVLIYSTCTYNHAENSANAEWLLSQAGLEYISLSLPASYGVQEMPFGYQCFPHRVRGEGFFLACFRKPGRVATRQGSPIHKARTSRYADITAPWFRDPSGFTFLEKDHGQIYAIAARIAHFYFEISQVLRRIEPVLETGTIKQGALIPAHALALSTKLNTDIPTVAMDTEQAIRYLRKEDPLLDAVPRGWMIATWEGHPLGWVKGLGNRVNNYFPKEWRILSREFLHDRTDKAGEVSP